MSTWQIFSDAGDNFRWEISGRIIQSKTQNEPNAAPGQPHNPSPRLPSMADILVQGCSKLLENGDAGVGNTPMFRTGLGKSVVLKESSIAKALSVLGDDDDATDSGCSNLIKNGEGGVGNAPMFRTGLGKSVVLKESSIAKALSVLGNDDDATDSGCSKLMENGDEGVGNAPMFWTGSGKSVVLKESSIAKALSFLRDDDAVDSGEGHIRHNGCSFSNSIFQTGSGKMVNISPAGLVRAKTLLGLEEDNGNSNFKGLHNKRKMSTSHEPYRWQNLSALEMEGANNCGTVEVTSVSMPSSICKTGLVGSKLKNEVNLNLMQSKMLNSASKPPPIKFHTAGGRSLSVSSDALQRARRLLADPEIGNFSDEGNVNAFSEERRFDDTLSNKENDFYTSFYHQGTAKSKPMLKSFTSPLRSSSQQVKLSVNSENIISGSNLMEKFDAVDHDKLNSDMPSILRPLSDRHTVNDNSLASGTGSRINQLGKSLGGPLVDVSNSIGIYNIQNEKRRLKRSSISPFKRPRSSKFSTPLKRDVSFVPSGLSTLSSEHTCHRRTVSSKYPFRVPRMYLREYFEVPPLAKNMLDHLPDQVRLIKSDNAEKYMFCDESGLNCIGGETFSHMLAQSGASMQYASKKWVANHYKWIVWKLACYERCYPAKSAGNFLTVSSVLEELKYRYEREVNHGHRSAIKRILEGDASPSSMLVLCISAISNCEPKIETDSVELNAADNSNAAKVELTDGWYSVIALLDVLLAKQLAAGKLFVGQKLRIWGAGLCGWVGPVSPLEASRSVTLLLHINGTYRAHWDARLGFCKGVGAPLAFRCIKCNGGSVPRTLVGVTRIYPVLYRERLSNGGSIVRSERMETKMMQLYNQRRSNVVEGIISEFQRGNKGSHVCNDSDSEEGAKFFKILETAAEPEVIMAEMSPEQLTSFASFQAKLEATRQSDIEKAIEKALQDSGLSEREVTPFMRVRVVGLTSTNYQGKGSLKEGLITIWNPTEKQQSELVEGQAYAIAGLVPLYSDLDMLYLQARGCTIKWQPVSPSAIKHFKPFFSPRKSVLLSILGEVPLSSEFDIVAFVVYVGEVYTAAHQKKQWVFVTDGSNSESAELSNSLLAISFCIPCTDDSVAPINHNLAGSTVGFCNLIKRAKDQINHLWVAEATENSTYFLSFDLPHCSHLKSAAASAQKWAKISSLIIGKLKEKVLFIIGDCKS